MNDERRVMSDELRFMSKELWAQSQKLRNHSQHPKTRNPPGLSAAVDSWGERLMRRKEFFAVVRYYYTLSILEED